jgi:hypothetical protein
LEKWVLEAMFVVGSLGFMKVIHVQLSDKRGEIVVLEESRQNGLRELVLLLYDE